MKKCLVPALMICLAFGIPAIASDDEAATLHQVVVDGSTTSPVLNDYTLLTRDAIQRAWQTPLDLNASSAVKGRVRIDYVVKRSGELDSARLVRSSGSPDMDKSLLDAIRAAQPFPPFPRQITAAKILVRANFIVADMPTVPVTMIGHDVENKDAAGPVAPPRNRKQLKWGRPAGAADAQSEVEAAPEGPRTPVDKSKKLKWGR